MVYTCVGEVEEREVAGRGRFVFGLSLGSLLETVFGFNRLIIKTVLIQQKQKVK